ncbi:DNA polymerase alpha subunit B-like [Actinia tenebrosa]|uniref:DNA polymerase alpha subunit B n=1 Tax=Actinia tenebrosa TaxID=6105 RepID=A0A6P8I8M9_ACTTE|nr:DNA polymerase alpha subunit B-like [Actinia tenebrosa]
MVEVTDEELQTEFEEFAVNVEDPAILDKLKEICHGCRLTAEDLVCQWISFAQTLTNQDLTIDVLEEFERKQLFESNKKNQTQFNKHEAPRMYTKDDLDNLLSPDEEDVDVFSSYAETPDNRKLLKKRIHTTPEVLTNKRHTSLTRTPGPMPFSPSSLSPAMATPSAKYASRRNAGESVCSFVPNGKTLDKDSWNGTGVTLDIDVADKEIALTERFKYMFQKQADKANVLNDMIDEMAERLKKEHGIEEFSNAASSNQVEINTVGMVCCDSVGKLNASSLMLEGSIDLSQGQQVKVDLSNIHQFALFPGQVIAARGLNSTGQKFVVNQIYNGVQLPFYSALDKNNDKLHKSSSPFSMMVVAGPFTTSDNLLYEPLNDLITVIKKDQPDLLILLGPFVDAKHEKIESGDLDETFEEMFTRQVVTIVGAIQRQQTKVVIVPSQRDVHHDFVYPQPPFVDKDNIFKDNKNAYFVSDPCSLLVNNIVIGITSTDVLLNLGSEETASPPGSSDRLGRLVKHLLYQHSYYPLHPTSEDINMDYEKFASHASLPCTPDILILPSDLRYFTKDILGCLCVNPGRLAKGQVGGTYARIYVNPNTEHTDKSLSHILSNSLAEVVRI